MDLASASTRAGNREVPLNALSFLKRWFRGFAATVCVLPAIAAASRSALAEEPPPTPAQPDATVTATAPPATALPAEAGAEAGKSCPVPDRVRVGAYINNIQDLDLKTHTYEFDTYLWFKWCSPDLDPAATMEFLNPSELWGMMITPTYEEPETFEDGTRYQVLRVQGRFNTKMPLYDYPFDRQFIGPYIEDNAHDATKVVYELDQDAVQVNPNLSLPGYILGKPELRLSTEPYPTNFGDTREGERPSYARAYLAVPLSRPLFSQVTLLFAPVGCVIICAALMFLLRPSLVDSRIGVGTTAMLTIVALQMTYNQELPDVGYLMLMDKIYLASYLYVLCGLAVVMRTSPKTDTGEPDPRAEQFSRSALTAFSTGYGIVCIILCGIAASHG